MISVLFRFILIFSLAVLAAYIAFVLISPVTALVASLGILGAALAYAYFNLYKIQYFLRQNAIGETPEMGGLWEGLIHRLKRQFRDLHEQVRSARQEHEHFIQAFQASPNGVIMLDKEDKIEWCNGIAESFFGLNFKRDTLQRVHYLIRRPEFLDYLTKRQFLEPLIIEGMGPQANLTLMVQLFPFGDSLHLLLAQDITNLRRTEAMRRDFVANVSHEMRTPLTVMMGFLETVQTLDLEPKKRDEYFDMMMDQAMRMKSLVEDLLALANLEANLLPAPLVSVQMRSVIGIVESDAKALSRGRQRIHCKIDASKNVLGEERELSSAFLNLVSNAVRYTPQGGEIAIRWKVNERGEGEFSVTDSGPGIAPEHLPRLTERFYRIDRSRSRETGGTGLGLAIVKHIANRHQAQVLIESTYGKGSKFTLLIPPERIQFIKPPINH
ncbi:PAS/PAC sensor signal transduction histidine kinase [Polynucleobacter meluiroseus]|uniref:Phosphate regulon sensor protein PhoR n=1 Tax=Polynucleobacter meluiroseus TaxID=1938814 RepID=A0A240E276_9BURK|nr:phosphate regulon sensor histidine kinase PhoR [Polynucleobacter meluiroseus]SNX29535.1 PAS/PAC sensor signal transduction histidine kinase [Polynucleobacter meluiroseus]